MKRMVKASLVAVVLALFTLGVMAEVSSVNIAGFVSRDLPPDSAYIMVGIGLSDNGENPTLKDLLGSQLRANANYALADRVILWDADTISYQAYALYDGDMEFYPCNTATQWDTSSPTNPVVQVGQGFWIVSASGSSVATKVTMPGELIIDEHKMLDLASGYQILAWPFSSDIALQDIDSTDLNKHANYALADRIVVWNGNSYQNYGLYTDGLWYPCNTATEWDTSGATDRVISLGEGFWFISQTINASLQRSGYFDNL